MDLRDFAKDNTTAELIGSRNFRQAVRNLEKRLKKAPDELLTIALKANLQVLLGDLTGSYIICSQLISTTPPISDPNLVELIYHDLCELRRLKFDVDERKLDSLWQNAISAQINAEKKIVLAGKWAQQSIRNGQWQQTVKAAMTIQKAMPPNSPKARSYWFWQIVARYIAGQAAPTDQLKAVQLGLVLKTLEKAVNDIPENAGSTERPGFYISSAPELKLLTSVFSREAKNQELIQAIEKVPESIKNEYAFSVDRARALRYLGDNMGRWNNAKASLDAADDQHQQWLLDDSRPWSTLAEVSTSQLLPEIDMDIFSIAKDMAERQARSSSFSRASQLALLSLRWHACNATVGSTNSVDSQSDMSPRLQICQEHFDRYADRHFMLDDIKDKIESFSRDEALLFSQYVANIAKKEAPNDESQEISQIKWLIAETNVLRVDLHSLKHEIQRAPQKAEPDMEMALRDFIVSCLRIYKISLKSTAKRVPTDSGPGDDACLLAVEALGILQDQFKMPSALYHCAYLLSEVLAKSKHNFDARTRYSGLLVQLGLYPSALSVYQELQVKDILQETMAPLVFTYISTTNPYDTNSFDARERLEKALSFYEKGIAKIPNYQQLALESQNYAQVLEMEDLARRLKDSPTRWLLGLELRRIARFRNIPYEQLNLPLDVLELPPDMNFQHLSPKSRKYPIFHLEDVDKYMLYIRYLAYLDLVHEVLINATGDGPRAQQILEKLQNHQLWEGIFDFDTRLGSEQGVIAVCKKLISLVLTLSGSSSDPEGIMQSSDELLGLTKTLWDDTRVSFWNSELQKHNPPRPSFYRECYATSELLQNIFKISDALKTFVQKTRTASIKAKRQDILERATDLAALTTARMRVMLDMATKVGSQLPERFVRELKDASSATDDVSKAVRDIVAPERFTEFTACCLRDTRGALEGLLNLKLRATKS